ncbi:hypothetical protein ACWEQG_01810 [Microbispora sp. NPDC004025]
MVTLSIPMEQIREEARQLDPVRVLLAVLVAPFLAVGWTARAVWTLLTLAYAAVKVGWQVGPQGPSGPSRPRDAR